MLRRLPSACACSCPRAAARVWSRATTACGPLSAPPSNPSKTAGSCSRPRLRLYAAQDRGPPASAHRALQCGPVTTRDLNLLYNSMSATIKSLERRGVVVVEERRAWRGCSEQTTLSSASGKAPVSLTNGQQQALAQIERARLDAHATWCWSTASPAPAKPRSTSPPLSAYSQPAAQPACLCPRSR